MPVIEVKMWEGRTKEQKAKIIEGITKVFMEVGVPAEHVIVILTDIPKMNWGSGGKPSA
ncbi:MAG: tautomerase family protein [Candidatus Bathyarchaeia archaeon]